MCRAFQDCCEACKVGILSAMTSKTCDFEPFSFGPPWDVVHKNCCVNVIDASPPDSRQKIEISDVCKWKENNQHNISRNYVCKRSYLKKRLFSQTLPMRIIRSIKILQCDLHSGDLRLCMLHPSHCSADPITLPLLLFTLILSNFSQNKNWF